MDFDRTTLEDLMKEADTFIYEVEHVESIKAQLDQLEWKHRFNDAFNLSTPKLDTIEVLLDLKEEGEGKKYID